MSTTAVQRLNAALGGRYRIESELGEGGMATVYLADDLRHERKVALKVLKPELAAVVGADRFLAEIKTTANLQHPHILPLFDSGEADGFLFYVMPHVDGESLRDRLDREHQLPVDDAVRVATNIAEALDYAHRQGVIHRDIKPANILLQDGKPVLSDFGIALAVSAGGAGRLTETGLSLGTPHYMSPEQATGDQNVGHATDIYALACVCYETLTGEPPYTGTTAQAVLGRIIQGTPVSATEIRQAVPENVDAAIRKALEKLPADRFARAAEFATALSDTTFRHGDELATRDGGGRSDARRLTAGLVLGAALVGGAVGWLSRSLSPVEAPPRARLEVTLEPGHRIAPTIFGREFDMSPDGSRMVYVGEGPRGGRQLWHRALENLDPEPLPGTDGAVYPAMSPDGMSVVFTAAGGLQTISLRGGPPTPLLAEGAIEPVWGDDGFVYFSREGAIHRIRATGGEVERVSLPSEREFRHPSPLPDGRGLLVTDVRMGLGQPLIAVIDEDGEARELVTGTMARFAPPAHIVYGTVAGTLMGAAFDLGRLEVTGPPVALVEGVQTKVDFSSQFALSERGTLLYNTGARAQSELVWVSRAGEVEPVDREWVGDFRFPSLSPDGTRLAVTIDGTQILVKELDRGPDLRLTFEGNQNDYATWTPDGTSVTFFSDRSARLSLWTKRADGSSRAIPLEVSERDVVESRWSPDGEWLVYRTSSLHAGAGDILAIRPGRDEPPIPLVATPFTERSPALSPDGRWLAYSSNDSGDDQVYVVPFPDAGDAKWVVSTTGGREPLWSHNGRELFYRNGQAEMVAVEVQTEAGFSAGGATVLFSAGPFRSDGLHQFYDVAPDDQRFIMVRELDSDTAARLIWVQDFAGELRERAGG